MPIPREPLLTGDDLTELADSLETGARTLRAAAPDYAAMMTPGASADNLRRGQVALAAVAGVSQPIVDAFAKVQLRALAVVKLHAQLMAAAQPSSAPKRQGFAARLKASKDSKVGKIKWPTT